MAAMENEVTKLCNVTYPIFLGGMGNVSTPELAAAVSNAGGCGILSSITFKSPKELRSGIQKTKSLITNNRPFGVNVSFFRDSSFLESIGMGKDINVNEYNRQVSDIIIDEEIPIVETTAGSGDEESIKNIVSYFSRYNIVIIHKCHTVKDALIAQQYGANIIGLDGFGAGGHYGLTDTSNMVLIPLAKKLLKIPIIAGGGIVNGSQFASALCLGAQGIKLGTRFCATVESPCHVNCKLAMVNNNSQDGTVSVFKNGLENQSSTMRVYNSKIARDNGSSGGSNNLNSFSVEQGMINGKIDDYIWSCGEGVCLIDDLNTCKEVIDTIMAECRKTIAINSKL